MINKKIKIIENNLTGQKFKLGRHEPIARGFHLRFRSYAGMTFPALPASWDNTILDASWQHNILGNDSLGDCTSAGIFHIYGALLGMNNKSIPFNRNDVIRFYSATTGYDPRNPETDQGGDEETVLNFAVNKGILFGNMFPHKLNAWITIDASDIRQIKSSNWLFGNNYIGAALPEAWVSPMAQSDGFVWDVAGPPIQENGHCFVLLGFKPNGNAIVSTWGLLGEITPAALAKYAIRQNFGECYTLLAEDWIDSVSSKAPNGFDYRQLQSDIESMKV